LLGLTLPFLGKPVHLDDANFLVLAEGARLDLWRPHAIEINWQGTRQTAFEVLSNPPGIGWFLAPVVDAGDVVQHLWMLLWLPLAMWGAWRLGAIVAGRGAAAAILLCGSPIALLATQARMPDLPLFACVLAGLGGVLGSHGPRRLGFALLLGCAALFRYSGAAMIPLVAVVPLLSGASPRAALREGARLGAACALPLSLLVLHDLHAYGAPHILAMVGFQGDVGDSGRDTLRKAVAGVTMLGGAAALPLLCWTRARPAAAGGLLGAALGGLGVVLSEQVGAPAAGTVFFGACGGAVLGGCAPTREGFGPHGRLMLLWLGGGLVFLLALRFTAARYWLPFFAPAVLLPLRHASDRLVAVACVATPALSLMLALDDLELAHAQRHLAHQVAQHGDHGLIAGHWGFQHHLEDAGWTALEEDAAVPQDALLAVSAVAWPQTPESSCLTPVARWTAQDGWPGPRVHTRDGAANIHAFVLSAPDPIESYAPWGFGTDPMDEVRLWRGCK